MEQQYSETALPADILLTEKLIQNQYTAEELELLMLEPPPPGAGKTQTPAPPIRESFSKRRAKLIFESGVVRSLLKPQKKKK